MVGVLSQTGAPAGVIINREGIGNKCVEDYLKNTQYPILMKIPYQKNIAEGLASGRLLIDIIPEFKKTFLDLYEKIRTGLESKAVA
jgi:MinD superfamily P-loop ATPase